MADYKTFGIFQFYKSTGLVEITITLETWRVTEFFYRIINRVYLFLGKDHFWIDCGYCKRIKGRRKCYVPETEMLRDCHKCVLL